MQKEEAKRVWSRLKIRTLLDLALLIPSSYEDRRLLREPVVGRENTLEVEVLKSRELGNRLLLELHLPSCSKNIQAVFFRVTSYHKRLFCKGSRHIVRGRVTLFGKSLQIVQPKVLKEYGDILPRYKVSVKESIFRALLGEYLNERALYEEGLDSFEAAKIMRLHFPSGEAEIPSPQEKETLRVLKFVEAYNHLKKLRGKREEFPALEALKNDPGEFIDYLPFELTPGQWRAIVDIRRDLMREERAARRVVIGDVGSGKTMVIFTAAVMAGERRSILMAPTSILARQIYEEAKKYLSGRLSLALVVQGSMEGEYESADFIIGTHAILYLEKLPRAALVMVDEQHRFGTAQRASLESMVSEGERRPHYIQFSATPIPRTQAMMESELVDVSIIAHRPFERNIRTEVIGRDSFGRLLEHIHKELEKEHQILLVYPLVESSEEIPYQSIEEARGFWEKRYEGVYVTHGRDRNKEKILEEFRDRGRILLATTVIEVGISLPRLTTIVIVGAERLGLATLHQLRGRVGRNGLESFCFLYSKDPDNSRLREFSRTDDGFEIARLDLKYRESGDILDGTVQSGQRFRWLDMACDEEIIAQAKARLDGSGK